MVNLTSNTGKHLEFVCDTESDFLVLQSIQSNSPYNRRFPKGTTAYVKESRSVWLVNEDMCWEKF